jgi:hypothetical protein
VSNRWRPADRRSYARLSQVVPPVEDGHSCRSWGRAKRASLCQLGRFLTIFLQEGIDPLFSDWPPERQAAALEVVNSLADAFEDTT